MSNPRPGDGCRRLFCTNYDVCLDEAVRSGWSDFNCEGCGCKDLAWDGSDLPGCLLLLLEIFGEIPSAVTLYGYDLRYRKPYRYGELPVSQWRITPVTAPLWYFHRSRNSSANAL